MQDSIEVSCPHCGAPTTFFPDPSEGERQDLIEDCQVCCNPIVFHVEWRGQRARVRAERLD
jgi:hypothetical protein